MVDAERAECRYLVELGLQDGCAVDDAEVGSRGPHPFKHIARMHVRHRDDLGEGAGCMRAAAGGARIPHEAAPIRCYRRLLAGDGKRAARIRFKNRWPGPRRAQRNLSLVIIGGSGPALAACRELVAASPFKERMLLCCDVPHDSTLAAIARATVYTLPSRREPFGIVILEAAALAIPVVASLVEGIPWASRWPVQAPVASPRGRPPLTQPAALVATSNRNRLFRPTLAIRNRRR